MKNLAQKIDISKETVKERPVLFNAQMVKAILEGRKTQTRRVMKEQPPSDDWLLSYVVSSTERKNEGKRQWVRMNEEKTLQLEAGPYFTKPYQIGDRLWVRETFRFYDSDECPHADFPCGCPRHGTPLFRASHDCGDGEKWTPSIHMPRWASRILLEITNVRVEHLNDISEEDSIAEGVESVVIQDNISVEGGWTRADRHMWKGYKNKERAYRDTAKDSFKSLWQEINGQDSWDVDPWVWVIEFRVIEGGRQ